MIELPIIACPCLLCNLSHSYFLFQVSFISFYRSGYFATWRLCRLWSKKERVLSSLHSSCEPSLASAVIMQSAVMQHSQLFAAKIFSSSFHLAMPISSSLSDAMIIMRYKCHRTFVIQLFPAPLLTLCAVLSIMVSCSQITEDKNNKHQSTLWQNNLFLAEKLYLGVFACVYEVITTPHTKWKSFF